MPSLVALYARREELNNNISLAAAEKNEREMYNLEGQLSEVDNQIMEAAIALEEFRAAPRNHAEHMTFAQEVLGSREDFKGLAKGFNAVASYASYNRSVQRAMNAVVTLPGLVETDQNIPAQMQNAFYAFADTLPVSSAMGTVNYMQATGITGNPATWEEDTVKAQVLMAWTEVAAIPEVIAGIVPISEIALEDYGQLESVINGDLVRAKRRIEDSKFLSGTNASGITGVLNTTGIQEYTALPATPTAVDIFDSIRKMKTLVTKATGLIPNYIAMTPELLEILDLHKTTDNLYQFGLGVMPWGMRIVEDVNMDGLLVYVNSEAEITQVGNDVNIRIGTIDDQFGRNQVTMRAEGRKGLKVKQPKAFVHSLLTVA